MTSESHDLRTSGLMASRELEWTVKPACWLIGLPDDVQEIVAGEKDSSRCGHCPLAIRNVARKQRICGLSPVRAKKTVRGCQTVFTNGNSGSRHEYTERDATAGFYSTRTGPLRRGYDPFLQRHMYLFFFWCKKAAAMTQVFIIRYTLFGMSPTNQQTQSQNSRPVPDGVYTIKHLGPGAIVSWNTDGYFVGVHHTRYEYTSDQKEWDVTHSDDGLYSLIPIDVLGQVNAIYVDYLTINPPSDPSLDTKFAISKVQGDSYRSKRIENASGQRS
ncbi:hypothetical protein BD410DRAFT_807878 [Rickenella mellea]|uniref:Uncharacterized protein n=1 Tax=Rickenella mellea TaxID=50990 RepID=A0A4Y7PMV8_9AGAM|nr:hypothetical protein BD410DRAFT_807878 [Rickenella mellea]